MSGMEPVTGWQEDGSYVPCSECRWKPPTEHPGSGAPAPLLSREAQARLQADLDEMARCRHRAWAAAANYVVG